VASQATYPVRVEARLNSVSRWLWLLTWFLAIPYYIVLAFLGRSIRGHVGVSFCNGWSSRPVAVVRVTSCQLTDESP